MSEMSSEEKLANLRLLKAGESPEAAPARPFEVTVVNFAKRKVIGSADHPSKRMLRKAGRPIRQESSPARIAPRNTETHRDPPSIVGFFRELFGLAINRNPNAPMGRSLLRRRSAGK